MITWAREELGVLGSTAWTRSPPAGLAMKDVAAMINLDTAPAPAGDMRSFNASLGTVPDYAPPEGTRGVLLAGVRPGGGAEKGGMKRGDVLIRLGTHDVGSVEDLMYALNDVPGEPATLSWRKIAVRCLSEM